MVLVTMGDMLDVFESDIKQVLKFGVLVPIVLHYCKYGVYFRV